MHFIVCKFYLKRKQNCKHILNSGNNRHGLQELKGKCIDACSLFWNAIKVDWWMEGYIAGYIWDKANIDVNDRPWMVDTQVFTIKLFKLFFIFEIFHNKMLGGRGHEIITEKYGKQKEVSEKKKRHQADNWDYIKMFYNLLTS